MNLAASTFCLLLATAAALAQTKPDAPRQTKAKLKAADAFAQIQAEAKQAHTSDFAERTLPADLVRKRESLGQDKGRAWRAAFLAELAAARTVGVREKGDDAVVRFTIPPATEERELPLRCAAGNWVVAAAQSYVVKGKSLDDRRGKDAAHLALQARTDKDEGYGKSAFSFTHVTGAPDECKNRMDVWYCHNGDLHTVGDDRIADLGSQKLAKVDGLPVGVDWKARGGGVAAKKGNTYVVHCLDGDRRDFYVKLALVDVKPDAVTLEWTLLSDGLNVPPSIAKPQVLVSNDGADGADGLCGKGK